MSVVIGVDFGANTGIAIVEDGRVAAHKEYQWPKGPENEGARYASFWAAIDEVVWSALQKVGRPGGVRVTFEDVGFFRGGAASKQNAGYRAILMFVCTLYDVSYAGVEVSMVKRALTDDAKASKDDMRSAAANIINLHLGTSLPTEKVGENEADAIGAALAGARLLDWGENDG